MAYLGRTPQAFGFGKLDSITFDGVTATYALTKDGQPFSPMSPLALQVVLNGVPQEPFIDFTLSGSSITFITTPPVGSKYFATSFAERFLLNTISDGTVTNAKIGETISIAKGGTGGTTAAQARTNLDLYSTDEVKSLIYGQDYKASVRFTTTANITLSGLSTQAGGDWPSGLTIGDRILVKDNSTGSQNGIYAAAAGAWTRATDANGTGEITPGAIVLVEEGAALADTQWMLTTDGTITIGTTTLTFARKDAGASIGTPVGSIILVAQNTAPTNYLKANGAAISRTTYAALFAAIGTTFGVGNGSTTFNVPDLRGEFIRGWDDSRGVDVGRAFGSLQLDSMQQHTGAFQTRVDGGVSGVFSTPGASANMGTSAGVTVLGTVNFDPSLVARTSTETRPRNIALLACIKF